MRCPRCGSHHVNIQAVTLVTEQRKKGFWYWLLIGWWWEIIAWVFFTLPKLIFALFSKKTKVVSKTHSEAVCQNCGYRWKV